MEKQEERFGVARLVNCHGDELHMLMDKATHLLYPVSIAVEFMHERGFVVEAIDEP